MRFTGASVFDAEKGFVKRDLCLEGDRIVSESSGTVDLAGYTVIPGLTDLHFHGAVGVDFSEASLPGLQKLADHELSRGVAYLCPAGMTLPEEQLTALCRAAAVHRRENTGGAELVGVHLEGPFLSEAKKGAQNGAYLHDPDPAMLRRLYDASEGLVKLVTIAPERPHAEEFIREAARLGVTVSLGHTTASYDVALAAYQAGARQATHLFNAMPPFGHRDPGVIGAAADCREVKVELISDGVHVHPSVVRSVFRLFGRDRVLLISDSLRASGMPDGVYPFGGQEIEVHGVRATILGHPETLAGSVSDLMACMRAAVSFGVPLFDAVTAAAVNPARVLGIYDRAGSLEPGKEATLVVLDEDLSVRAVVQRGRPVHGQAFLSGRTVG